MSDEPRKARKSRFDRRSRSPVARDSDNTRARSPIAKSPDNANNGETMNAAARAQAAAAKISANINAQKARQDQRNQVDVPPIISTKSPSADAAGVKSPEAVAAEVYEQDGDYIQDIEVNDLRNRYTLTKGSTQKMIKEKTGADVTTRGSYVPNKAMATAASPPLYLHITSTTKEGLDKAVKEIQELMKEELPNLIDERRHRRRDGPPREEERQAERDARGRRKYPEHKIPIDLEPIPGFNLRAQVVGQGGQYVKYIQAECNSVRVQIKGRGSGYYEHDTGIESDEQMYLHVFGPNAEDVERAKVLAEELLESVRKNYDDYKEHRSHGGGGPRGGDRGGDGYNHHERSGSGSYGGGGGQYGGGRRDGGGSAYHQQAAYDGFGAGAMQSPIAAPQAAAASMDGMADPAAQMEQMQAWMAYYAANPAEDPYAQYGGYAYMVQYWQQQAQAQPMPAGQNGDAAPPPPPPPPAEDLHQVPPPPEL